MSKYFNIGKAIKAIKPNIPETELQKKIKDLKIATQKSKASKAKLDQTVFELKNNKKLTFNNTGKKSESNTEAYKRIQGENTKVLKGMLDKATKKADGGRIGRKMGGGSDMSNTNVKKKYKGFAKLPETIQIKINKKLAKKV